MSGWSETEALDMNVSQRVPKGHVKSQLDILKEFVMGHKIETFKTPRLTKDGKRADVWLPASAPIDEAGKLYAISTTERNMG